MLSLDVNTAKLRISDRALSILRVFLFAFILLFSVQYLFSQSYEIDAYDGQKVNTCSGTFYDSGGSSGDYANDENYTVTFCSDNAGQHLKFDFTGFNVRVNDTLYIYNGSSTGSPLLGKYSSSTVPGIIFSGDTCLTFSFISNSTTIRPGWVANISCACPPANTSPVVPAGTEVCAGVTINYSVNYHDGSVYDWTIVNGTPLSVPGGGNSQNITWDMPGGESGSIKVVETTVCGSKDSSELEVDILTLPVVNFTGLNTDYCIDAAAATLTGIPDGGVFTGPGMAGNLFNSSVAGPGTHDITYTWTNSSTGCTNQKTIQTIVHNKPSVTFYNLNAQYDLSDPSSVLIGDPLGGTFSGPGISGITFTPSSAGAGTHTIRYTYSDAYCTTVKDSITVVSDYNFMAGAKVLTSISGWCSPEAAYTTVGASADQTKGSCWNSGPNFNRWFKFRATGAGATIQLKTGGDEGTLQYPYVALWDESNAQLACATYSSQYSDLSIGTDALVIGNWYYISVDNYNNTGYRGTFTLCVSDAADYDFKSGAIELTNLNNWCSSPAAYTTINASADLNRGSCWTNGPNYNRWFKFQAVTTQALIKMKTGGTEGTLQNGYLALWDESNNEMACERYTSAYSDLTVSSASLIPGQWYYISVDNYTGTGYSGTFTLCIDKTVDYDFKAGAIELTDMDNFCSAAGAYSTVNATADENRGSCWNTGPNYNRWFKFQADTNEVLIRMKTGGSEGTLQYGYIALWDDAGSQLACEQYSTNYSDLAIGSTSLIKGNTYYISVDNYANSGYCGTFTLCINKAIDYDFKEGAVEITDLNNYCSGAGAFTTVNATADEIKGSCWNSGPNYNRWFKFQADTTVILVQMKTGGAEGTLQYGFLALWDEANNQMACNQYVSNYSDLTVSSTSLVPGNTYYISVDNAANSGYRGTFTLCIKRNIDYDFKAGAIELTDINNFCSAEAAFTTINATADQSKGSCWNNGPNYNRWFKFQAETNEVLVRMKTGGTEGTLQYGYVALWDDADNQLACGQYTNNYSDLVVSSTSLVPGNTYYISVDNYANAGYRGTFTLCIDKVIDYDFKAGAVELTDLNNFCSAAGAYTTMNASADETQGSCWNTGPNYNRWFKFEAVTNEVMVQMKTGGTEGTLQYGYMALWDDADNQISCSRYSYNYSDLVVGSTDLVPGNTYYISVDNYANSSYRGTFTLCINKAIDYDFKAGAVELTDLDNFCSTPGEYTTVNATADETKGSCWNSGPNYNRWFKFTADTSVILVQMKTGGTEGTLQYGYLALWDDIDNQLACSQYSSNYSDLTVSSTALTPGNTYYISVDNYANTGYQGTFTLCIGKNIDYDFKAGAIELTDLDNFCSAEAAYTTINATADEAKGSCWNTGPNYNRWFKFVAVTNEVMVQMKTGGTEGTLQNGYLALWNNGGVQLACNQYSSAYSDLTVSSTALTPGNTYYISVDNYANTGYRGTFTLCINKIIDYDFKAGAIELTDLDNFCSAGGEYTTVNASSDETKGSCWNNGPNYNRWFKFQADTNEVFIQMKTGGTEGTLQNGYLALWDDAGAQLSCSQYTSNYSDLTVSSASLVSGKTYYISVDNYADPNYRGTFTICINRSIDYDYKEGAKIITDYNNYCSALQEFTTVSASADQVKGSCWNTGPNYNRWFKFQATTSDVTIQVKTGGAEGTMRYGYVALFDELNVQLACAMNTFDYSDLEITKTGLTIGNWYYVAVDNYSNVGYTGTFTLCMDDALSYNFKDGAVVITSLNNWCSSSASYTTLTATADQSKGSCWTNGPNYNRWFKFQAVSSSISVQVRTTDEEGTLRRPFAALWNESLSEVACNIYSTNNSDIELSSTSLLPGNWYYISVDNSTGTGYQGSFTLCVTDNIINDLKANAIELSDFNNWCSSNAKYNNSIASGDDVVGSCFGGGVNKRNVWFKFQAKNPTVTTTVTTGGNFGSMNSQQIAIFDASGIQKGCSGPLAGQGALTMIVSGLTVNSWYWISVDDNNTSGTFSLCIDDDNVYPYPSGATELANINNWCSPDAAYTNVGSPSDTKSGTCWSGTVFNNKWFKFQATTKEINVKVNTGGAYGSMQRQQVALWNTAGTLVACSKYLNNQGIVPLQTDTLTIGNWYWISVDDNSTSGTFTLCINNQVDFDYKSRAIIILNPTNWCSSDAGYDNIFATADQSMGTCWTSSYGGSKNVWFKFTAATKFISISVKTGNVYGSMQRQQFSIRNSAGTQVGCAKWINTQGTLNFQTDTLKPGMDYWISVDDDYNPGTFTLCVTDQINYDFKDGAVIIADPSNYCSTDAAFDNIFATPDQSMGSCWSSSSGGNKNVWFKFKAINNFIKVSVKTGNIYGSMQRQQFSIWNAAGIQVGCAKWINNQGVVTFQTDTLKPGMNYWISVDDDYSPGTFSLCVTNQVDYDFRAGAVVISDPSNYCSSDAAFDNIFASGDQNMGSCWSSSTGGNKNVWFKFTAATNFINISVKTGSTYGSMYRQQFSLWNSAGIEVGCSKWVSNQGIVTFQTDTLKSGNSYWISVDDDYTSGTFSLCTTDQIGYDFQSGAVEISDPSEYCSANAAYDNIFATDDQSMGSCWTLSNGGNKNVWFKFTAETNFIKVSVLTGNVYGSMQRQQFSVWNAAGTEVGCAKWVSNQGTVTYQTDTLKIGNKYWISVDDDYTSGTFSLCITDVIDFDYKAGAL